MRTFMKNIYKPALLRMQTSTDGVTEYKRDEVTYAKADFIAPTAILFLS